MLHVSFTNCFWEYFWPVPSFTSPADELCKKLQDVNSMLQFQVAMIFLIFHGLVLEHINSSTFSWCFCCFVSYHSSEKMKWEYGSSTFGARLALRCSFITKNFLVYCILYYHSQFHHHCYNWKISLYYWKCFGDCSSPISGQFGLHDIATNESGCPILLEINII